MYEYLVEVGYTLGYPVIPDQHYSYVRLIAPNDTQATLIAAQMVSRHGMATSTSILEVEL